MQKIVLKEYGILPDTDISLALYELFKKYPRDTEFVFENGDYYFSKQAALKADYRISNSDVLPVRSLGVWCRDMHGCTLSGNGARLWFSGHMQPFTFDSCSDISLNNFYIDWKEPLAAEGIVVAFGEQFIDLHIDNNKFPHRFCNNWLDFYIGSDEWFPLCHRGHIQFDFNNRAVRRNSGDSYCPKSIESLGGDIYRFNFDFCVDTVVGNIFVLRHNERMHTGIFAEKCRNMCFTDITVHSCGGLGCLAQFCEDLTYRRVNFLPNTKLGRLISNGRDDGMHITCCSGTVTIEECSFLGLMDDPINVHGCCVTSNEAVNEYTLRCKYRHVQARGFKYWAKQGDEISFINRNDMSSVGKATAKSYVLEDLDTFLLEFDSPLPNEILEMAGEGECLALDNITNTAEFICRKNRFGSCRARGVLVSTPKKVLIEENLFESSGSAILVAGDANGWFESGECHSVTIRKNVFTSNCLSSMYQFCEGVISVCPVVPKPNANKPFHKNIKITDNVFDSPDVPVLYAFSCENLEFSGNLLHKSPAAEKWHPSASLMKLEYCKNANLSGNTITGEFSLSTKPQTLNCI